jgi:tRNA (uracil-5-)-methyltransferase TRM9
MSEWLRSVTRNHMGLSRPGSNPGGVVEFLSLLSFFMDPSQLEKEHVQQVYSNISTHFSATRYKPWPVVDKFMRGLPPCSVGCDLGSGNGKNALPFYSVPVFSFCLDFSYELTHLAVVKGALGIHASIMSIPLRDSSCDFVMCIAVLHHLSTDARRQQALCEMERILRPGGKALLFVWAFEPERNQSVYRHELRILADEQDVLVPWTQPDGSMDWRYYHLFREGELDLLVSQLGTCNIIESGFDRDNYFVVFEKQVK